MADLTSLLVETLEAVLGLTGAEPELSFFSAGGTSLQAEIYARTASAATGRTVTFTDIFQHPSPAELAAALTAREEPSAPGRASAAAPSPTSWHPVSENQASRLERLRRSEESGRPAFRSHAELIVAGFDLQGPLDEAALDAAARAVVGRHSALRTCFRISEEGFTQRVEPEAYGIETVDARHLHPAEVLELAWQPLDLRGGRLARFLLAAYPEDRHQLWVTVEHIVSDGVSGHVVLGELAAEYSGLRPAPTDDLQGFEFAALESALCQDAQGQAARSHWLRQIGDGPVWRTYPHPELAGPGDDAEAGDVLLLRTRPVELGRALRSRAAQHGTTLHALVVLALARAAAQAADTRDVTVYWYTANRNLPRVATTVGSLAGLTMARIADVPRDLTDAAVRAATRTVAESMAYAFYPIERVAREGTGPWLMPDDEPFLVLHVNEDPEVAEPRPPLEFAGLRTAAARTYGRRERRGYTLDASIGFTATAFQAGLSYRDGMIPGPAAARLLDAFTEELERIAEGTS